MNLGFYMPTRIIMADNVIEKNNEVFKSIGKKVLIVTGKHSAKANGSLDDVLNVIKENEQEYVLFDKVMSNPTIDLVYEGAALAKKEKVDFVIAIGGGSPMDAAKSIALLACQNIERKDLFSGKYEKKILPMIFIPTTAGTGSEVTQYSILTNDELETKTTVAAPFMFPTIAMLDGKYMNNLSKSTTINTAIDALSHAVEGYLSIKSNELTNSFALDSIKLIASEFNNLKNDTLSIESRNKLLYASTLAGIVIAHTGTTAVHSMGYSLTYFKNIDHGRANGLLLPRFLKYVNCYRSDKINVLLQALGLKTLDELEVIFDGFFGKKEKITKEEIYKFSSKAITAKNIANCIVYPNQDDLIRIMTDVFKEE